MGEESRPVPVVTISDPGRPGEVVEVVGDDSEPYRPSALQLQALTIVLVLLAGVISAVVQTRDQHRAQVALEKAVVGPTYVSVVTARRLALVVSLGPELAKADVVRAAVEGFGWTVVTAHARSVGLAHPVVCGAPLVPPTAVRALVEQQGQRRTVDLLQDQDLSGLVRDGVKEACGDLDAGHALTLLATPAHRLGDQVVVDLAIRNRSAYDVRLVRVVVDEVTTAAALPVTVLRGTSTSLHLVLSLGECLADGQVGSTGAGQALRIELAVNGRGGPATVPVTSLGLQGLIDTLRTEKCGP